MPGITRRAALASALAPAVLRGQRPAGDKPNLLFVWTDQQRADTMAAYGNAHFRVPAMNRLAEKSVVFDRYYVTQPVCTPSRSSILTGLWPHQNGTINNNVPLPATARCWPELLSDSAYRCGYFGKWHLGDEIFAQHGFHDWAGIEDGYIPHYSAARDRNARSAYHHFLLEHGYKPNTQQGTFSRGFACGLPAKHCKPSFLAARAEDFIERNRANPWLLSVNFLEPHSPYTGPYNDLHSSVEAPVPPNYPGPMEGREPRHLAARREATLNQRAEGQDLRQRAGWERLNRNYAGLCSQVDQALSRILWALETSGQAHNTVIVFTSDHGEMMGAHSLTGKGVMFESLCACRCSFMCHSGIPRTAGAKAGLGDRPGADGAGPPRAKERRGASGRKPDARHGWRDARRGSRLRRVEYRCSDTALQGRRLPGRLETDAA